MKDVVSIIFGSVYSKIGWFMDLIGIIVYVKPEWTEKLSFSNLIQQYLPLWISIGSILLVLSIAYEASKKIRENSKNNLSNSGSIDIIGGDKFSGDKVMGDKVSGDKNVYQINGKKKDIESEEIIKDILDLLSSFEKKFEMVRHSSDRENNLSIFKETEFELHKIGTEYLPKIDVFLDDSEQLKDIFNELFRYSNIYGIELRDALGYIKAGRGGEELVIQKEISLRTDGGKAYSQVKKHMNLFRQQLKDRLA